MAAWKLDRGPPQLRSFLYTARQDMEDYPVPSSVVCVADYILEVWDMRTSFDIELKMDVSMEPDDGQLAAIKAIVISSAQLLFAQAIMLAGKRQPQIQVRLENNVLGIEVLNVDPAKP